MVEWSEAQVAEGVVLRLRAGPGGIRSVAFPVARAVSPQSRESSRLSADKKAETNLGSAGLTACATLLSEAVRQLRAYFRGELRAFDLPLDFTGTPFQVQVWRQLLKIPYGETRSYAEVAAAIGSPQAVRAVGAANGANPIAIVVPCHRVVGASGKLVGYGGGLELKKRLLALEQARSGLWAENG